MTQSWLVALFLKCPQTLLPSIHCPNATVVAEFEQAVKAGDIWWHAFPHNAELAAAGTGMVAAGTSLLRVCCVCLHVHYATCQASCI